MKHLILTSILAATALIAGACGNKASSDAGMHPGASAATSAAKLPEVNADSAFQRVADQVAMGPRIHGTDGHALCVGYIISRLEAAGAEVSVQDTVFAPVGADSKRQRVRNITGIFNSGAPRHVMLLAHYDTRPWADQEEDTTLHSKPIDGANDGASGVAVLLEIARLMKDMPKNVEVEMLFVDAEDAGSYADDFSWCLGSQAWADAFDPTSRRVPEYAILLDMVGGKNAVFPHEYFSERYARQVNDRVWKSARELGFGDRFPDEIGGALNDDHIHVLRMGIPAIDIVESAHPATGSFNPTWHTLDDNIDNIDRNTLKMVGDVVINTIFK